MPVHSATIEDLDRYELATILAGLRLLQAAPALPEAIEEIATDCGGFAPLHHWEIDTLCDRINAKTEFPWRDVTEAPSEATALDARAATVFTDAPEVSEEQQAEAALAKQINDPTKYDGGA